MERSARTQRTLSKQDEFDEDDEIEPAFSVEKEQEAETLNVNSESASRHPTSTPTLHRSRSQSKVKLLVRSHALREESSPPPDPPLSPTSSSGSNGHINNNNNNISNNNNNINGNCLSVTVTRHKLNREGSSQGSMDSNWSACLSRGSSIDQYTDSTGVDLEQFISDTLNRNQKDRKLLLTIENDLVNLVKDSKRSIHKFPSMSSYQRMLVHRAAAYFGMDHNVDPSGHQVVVNKTKSTRLPDVKFNDFIRDDFLFPEEPRRSILKRDSSSFDETSSFKSPDRHLGMECRRSKSFEEREEEYEKVKKRIFNRELGRNQDYLQSSSQDEDDLRWPGDVQPWTSSESEHLAAPGENSHQERKSRMLKVESYESKDTLKANSLRLSISKSFSFGGYDQSSLNTKVLTKQDSGSSMSSRVSPSSSGYKSQSQRSDITLSATPSPSATPQLTNQLSSQSRAQSPETEGEQVQTVMWAVTSMDVVPPGSILINPQTGQPYTNSDGSIYHFDPENPPKMSPEEGDSPDALDPPSTKSPVQNQNQSDSVVKKKSSPKASNTTVQTTTPSSSENVHTSNSVVFCNKSSQNTTSQEQTQTLTKSQSNIPPLVKSQQQSMSMFPPQVSTSAYGPYPVTNPSQICYPNQPLYQPAYSSMASCNLVLQPPGPLPEGFYPPNPQQPLVYTPPIPIPANYDHRISIPDGQSNTQDLSNYLMGLNLGEGIQNGNDNRSILYWPSGPNSTSSHPPAHVPQGQNQSLPVFYAPPNTPLSSSHTVAPRYPPLLNGYTSIPMSMERTATGGGYLAPSTEWNGPQCNFPQSLQMFYNTQCNSGHNIPNSSINNFCNNHNSGPNGVLIQFPPPTHPVVQPSSQPGLPSQQNYLYNSKMTALPNSQQPNICPQYTMYGNGYGLRGCFPLHYSQPNQPPHSAMLHAPNPQMGSRSSPPVRALSFARSRSPAVRERSAVVCPGALNLNLPETSSSLRFANVPTHTHMPFYVTRLLPHAGDVRLMGSNNPNSRLGYPLIANTTPAPPSQLRKNRVYPRTLM